MFRSEPIVEGDDRRARSISEAGTVVIVSLEVTDDPATTVDVEHQGARCRLAAVIDTGGQIAAGGV